MKKIFGAIALSVVLGMTACQHKGEDSGVDRSQFVTVRDGEFYIGDSVYRYVGTNFWYGGILASEGNDGNRERLALELDSLQSMGVNNLRILVGGDGEEGLVAHISPTLQAAPGIYNVDLLTGLDYLLADLEERGMKAVLYLNNAWEWSGGFSTYLEWAGEGKAAIPAVDGYQAYVDYTTKFFNNEKAQELAARHVRNIVGRVNSITGKPYSESPAIMAWQIANEPRAFSKENKEAFAEWIASTASLIKEIDPNHLVSIGSEGMVGCELDMDLWTRIHSLPTVDYATIHIWPYNWNWVNASTMTDSLIVACRNTTDYINSHYNALSSALVNDSMKYSKPLVLEEFGYPRDNMQIAIGSGVTARDGYYRHVFSEVENGGKLAGVNFWGWGGLAQPPHKTWEPGDPYTGDPAQEDQGLYSVFASDTTTISLIKDLSRNFNTTH
ncbi:MAG: beta-mannosidase [Bacteroides sp.]|nr:beta-mannosidase [Bacteroides sp.]